MNHNYHEDHSDEILIHPPKKLINRSILFTLVGIGLLIAAGLFIKVPETASGPAQLVSNLAFVEIYPAVEGNISHLLTTDGVYVENGTPLAIIQNAVDDGEYKLVKQALQQLTGLIRRHDTVNLAKFELPVVTEIGMMQGVYQDLRGSIHNLATLIKSDEYRKQKAILSDNLSILHKTVDQLDTRISLREESVDLAKAQVERNRELHSQGLIADAEFDRVKGEWVAKKMELEDLRAQNLQNQLSINHCLESIALKGHEHKKLLDAGFLAMREALEKNKEQLQKWEDTYLLKAPTAGRVQLAHAWEAQQKVTPQQAAITILPEKQRSCVVKISCAAKDAAKVSAGQRVLLEVQGFPAFTHGYLEGRVQHVSEVPTGGRYAVEALLVQGFITTLGKEVHFNRYAEGHGKVITSNQPFIARLLKNSGFLD